MGADEVMTARDVRLALGARPVLGGVDVRVRPGRVLGIVGPNGSGKSTLVRVLAGLATPDAGTVQAGGRDLRALRPRELAAIRAYVPQDTALPFDFTAREVVLMGRHAHLRRFGVEGAHDRKLAEAALADAGVEHLAARPVTRLSGGERQLVYLAKALAQEAAVLLLDEPTSALDLRHQVRVLGLMREQARAGRAVIAVLHDLEQAARHCDELLLLSRGRVRARGLPGEVLTPSLIHEVYGVRAHVAADDLTGALRVVPLDVAPEVPLEAPEEEMS